MNQKEQVRQQLENAKSTDEVLDIVADTIDELEIPIGIEHWMKTKRHLSAETGRSVARWFRELKKE